MAHETLKVEDRGAIRIVTIDRPDALNALNQAVLEELTAVLEDTAQSSARGLLLTGAGRAFVAGADIAAMENMSPDAALRFAGRGDAIGEMLQALPIPTCAAVGGFALGGGCELALACDFIYASEKAKFGQPEVKLGVIPGFGGTQRMLRRVGLARALELCMTGDVIGEYAFPEPLEIGDRLVFTDMMQYSFVKNTTFNGTPLPDLAILGEDGSYRVVRRFGYEDFRSRLG